MNETSKAHALRLAAGHFAKFLHGDGIDIGAGPDPLRIPEGTVRPWDVGDGDAMNMRGVLNESYDFVYSSHCLEHLTDVPRALCNWCRILRPGGWLYVTVPDYQLYEHLRWPSLFNPDHLHSFSATLGRDKVKRPNHWSIEAEVLALLLNYGVRIESVDTEDDGYDYNLGWVDQTKRGAVAQVCFIGRKAGGHWLDGSLKDAAQWVPLSELREPAGVRRLRV